MEGLLLVGFSCVVVCFVVVLVLSRGNVQKSENMSTILLSYGSFPPDKAWEKRNFGS